jgi:hypothetical protein
MLVAIKDNGTVEPITSQTHEAEFRQWRRNLSPADFEKICAALNASIAVAGSHFSYIF